MHPTFMMKPTFSKGKELRPPLNRVKGIAAKIIDLSITGHIPQPNGTL
jgi:hypothetical protein